MKRSTLLASTAALLLSAGVAVAAGEAVKQQSANDMSPPVRDGYKKSPATIKTKWTTNSNVMACHAALTSWI